MQWDVDLFETQDKWLLRFPESAQTLHVEPNLFIKTLEENGWLVTDILSPMRKVQVINQVRGLLLATEPSGFLKQLLAVSNVSVALSEAAPKPINATAPKNNKANPLPATRIKQPGKQKKLKPIPTANTQEPADKLVPVSEPASTPKPEKQQDLVAVVEKTVTAQPSPPSLLTGSPAVMALINHLRKTRPVAEMATANSVWHTVEESDIAQCLTQHPGLKRSALLREMTNHPDCRIDEGGINVRLSP